MLLDGRAKLWLAWRALALRRRDPELFERGSYVPLAVSGAKAEHVVAFARQYEGRVAIVVAGRLFLQLVAERGRLPIGPEVWQNTTVEAPRGAPPAFEDALTGATVAAPGGRLGIGQALAAFPGALLVGGSPGR
jgi:(1->4)-alpha-D-glucan 1-alpha-D-glucosylmutase